MARPFGHASPECGTVRLCARIARGANERLHDLVDHFVAEAGVHTSGIEKFAAVLFGVLGQVKRAEARPPTFGIGVPHHNEVIGPDGPDLIPRGRSSGPVPTVRLLGHDTL